MRDYDPVLSFGEEVASEYDEENVRGDEEETVAFLRNLAGEGPALELAIGTGRIAIPLAQSGVKVDGIELSRAMANKLVSKAESRAINVTIGDFADVAVEGVYPLIYVIYNTFFNLLTQDDQVRCFENVAAHLTLDGVFVIDAFTPGYLYRLENNQYVDAESIELKRVKLDVGRHDPVSQRLDESHIELTVAGVRLFPIVCRYAWPSELDLMARIAGLRLIHRWSGWKNEPFVASSVRHVSVYGK